MTSPIGSPFPVSILPQRVSDHYNEGLRLGHAGREEALKELESFAERGNLKCIHALEAKLRQELATLRYNDFPQDARAPLSRRLVHWAHRGALLNDPTSMHILGTSYLTGEGVTQDMQMGEYWLERAGNLGDLPSLHLLLLRANKVKDPDRRLVLLWKSAIQSKRDDSHFSFLAQTYEQLSCSKELWFTYRKWRESLEHLCNISKEPLQENERRGHERRIEGIKLQEEKLGGPFTGSPPAEYTTARNEMKIRVKRHPELFVNRPAESAH